MTVFCLWCGDGSPVLWPEQMQGLAALNLECSFEFTYYPEEELDEIVDGETIGNLGEFIP